MRKTISLLLLFGLLAGATTAEDEVPGISVLKVVSDEPDRSDSEAEDKILRKLIKTDVDLAVVDSPLKDVAELLSERLEVPIRLNVRALEDVALAPDIPVTFNLRGAKAHTLLRLLLRQLDLTYLVEPSGIVITTPGEAENHEQARFYPLADLLYPEPKQPGFQPDYDSLIDVITTSVEAESWSDGRPYLSPIADGLIILQMQEVHQLIASLLDSLRQTKSLPAGAYDTRPILAHPLARRTTETRQFLKGLTVTLDLQETPLSEFAQSLSRPELQVRIDGRALEDVSLAHDMPVTLKVQDAPLIDALNLLSERYDLAWYTFDNVLILTTPMEQETELETRVYPVRDILWHGLDVSDPKLREAIDQHLLRGFGGGGFFGNVFGTLEAKLEPLKLPPLNDYDTLIEALTIVEAGSWEELGGPGSIAPYDQADCLVITQTEQVHEKLIALLADIRRQQKPLDPATVLKELAAANQQAVVVTYAFAPTSSNRSLLSQDDLKRFAVRIKKLIATESWDEEEHFIDVTEQGLVVRQTAGVQRKVCDFLEASGFRIPAAPEVREPQGGMNGGGVSASKGDQPSSGNSSPQPTTPMNNQGGFF